LIELLIQLALYPLQAPDVKRGVNEGGGTSLCISASCKKK